MIEKIYKYLFLILLILINFSLIHKYNIFNGDDGILIPHIADYYFYGSKNSIICKEWPIQQFYLVLLSDLYLYYFDFGSKIISEFNLEFINIRFFSIVLYLTSFVFFLALTDNTKNSFWYSCIFLTIEPFLVMSHSIRHDLFIFLGLSILLYLIFNFNKNEKVSLILLPISWILLLVHPSGFPFIVISLIYLFIFQKKKYLIYLPLGLLAVFTHLLINGISIDQIFELFKNRYFQQEEYLIGKENAFTLEKLIDYFWNAKYKRHLLELLLFLPYFHLAFNFKTFSKKEKFIYLIPIIALLVYQIINYFNVSYFKHIYLILLIIYVKFNYEKTINFKYFLQYKISLVKISSIAFIILYIGIAIVFLPHNSWNMLLKNKNIIKKYIDNKNNLISAPLYYGFLYPKLSSKYLPIRQLGDKNCKKSVNFKGKIDVLLIDTKTINESKNDNPQFKYLKDHLNRMEKVEEIKIGRLATQSLDKEGYLYIFQLKKDSDKIK